MLKLSNHFITIIDHTDSHQERETKEILSEYKREFK